MYSVAFEFMARTTARMTAVRITKVKKVVNRFRVPERGDALKIPFMTVYTLFTSNIVVKTKEIRPNTPRPMPLEVRADSAPTI